MSEVWVRKMYSIWHPLPKSNHALGFSGVLHEWGADLQWKVVVFHSVGNVLIQIMALGIGQKRPRHRESEFSFTPTGVRWESPGRKRKIVKPGAMGEERNGITYFPGPAMCEPGRWTNKPTQARSKHARFSLERGPRNGRTALFAWNYSWAGAEPDTETAEQGLVTGKQGPFANVPARFSNEPPLFGGEAALFACVPSRFAGEQARFGHEPPCCGDEQSPFAPEQDLFGVEPSWFIGERPLFARNEILFVGEPRRFGSPRALFATGPMPDGPGKRMHAGLISRLCWLLFLPTLRVSAAL